MAEKCSKDCPLCAENKGGRANHKGHLGYKAPQKGGPEYGWLKKQAPQERLRRTGTEGPAQDAYTATYPALVAFVGECTWPEDGTVRRPGTVMLMSDEGAFKAWVHDRHAGLTAFVSAGGLAGLLQAVEDGLREDNLDWRRDRPQRGR